MESIENAINTVGMASAHTDGDSMKPMLKTGDTVIIKKAVFPLCRYDIPVYHRTDHLTMHRILKIKKSGYIICGDNRKIFELDITDKDIIGVLAGFYKNGKYISSDSKEFLYFAKRAARRLPMLYVYNAYKKVRHLIGNILKKSGILKKQNF